MDTPRANDSTSTFNDRATLPRGSGQVSFQAALDAPTLAAAQVARLAYRHYDTSPNNPDDLRRALPTESPYPEMIRYGNDGIGIYNEPASAVDTGIIAYQLVPDAPEGMMVYQPLIRAFEPLAPIIFAFRGTDNLWDVMRDLSLNNDVFVPTLYETKLTEFKNYITTYIKETDTIQNYTLIGHSLGAKFALDLAYELLLYNIEVMRMAGVYMFNGFYPVDNRWKDIYTIMSTKRPLQDDNELMRDKLRTHLKSHIIKGDFASMNMLRTPIGNVNIYPSNASQPESVITDDTWQQLSLTDYLLNTQHSIDNFALDNPKEVLDAFQFTDGQEFVLGTNAKEIFPQYTNGNGEELPLQLYRPNSELSQVAPNSRFLSNTHVHSNDLSRFKFKAYHYMFSQSTVTIVNGQAYLNVATMFRDDTNPLNDGYLLRILRTVNSGQYFIEEIRYNIPLDPQEITFETAIAWTAPTPVWYLANQGRMPLSIEFLTNYDIATASMHSKNLWTLGPFVDPGHRRDLDQTQCGN